jgi:hypothetical protein
VRIVTVRAARWEAKPPAASLRRAEPSMGRKPALENPAFHFRLG